MLLLLMFTMDTGFKSFVPIFGESPLNMIATLLTLDAVKIYEPRPPEPPLLSVHYLLCKQASHIIREQLSLWWNAD